MSAVFSAALQAALFARLAADPALAAIVGDAIFDAPPDGPLPEIHVTLGEERVRPFDTATSRGARHEVSITVHAATEGFAAAKAAAGAICAALLDAPLTVAGAHLVAIRFLRADAERARAPARRRIALRFEAILEAV